jgi:FecR protein
VLSVLPASILMHNLRLILLAGAFGLLGVSAQGGPLTEARVTKIVNRVQIVDPAKGTHAASLHETIKDEIELKTGVKSRSELLFQDETLTRLGPETSFSFKAGTRELSLERGTLLLQVPKGLGGAKIRTAAVTAAITGTTIMMEHKPGKSVKVLVLEGSLRLSIKGDSVVLRPGRMVLMRPDAKRIPPPVSVDLKKIVRTSSLVNMSKKKGGASLPSDALIEKEIAQQAHDKATRDLVETDIVIHGSGTTALNSRGRVIDVLARNEPGRSLTVAPTSTSGSTDSGAPGATPAPTPSAISASPTPAPGASATPAPGASGTPAPGASATPVPTASPGPSTPPGDDDDDTGKDKGDHNGDGHSDNGKGKGPGRGKHLRSVPAPPVDRARLSGRETSSPTARFSRHER